MAPMIHEMLDCLANAKYEFLPTILNKTMSQHMMGAPDAAFIRTGTIIPILESELVYPRGLKTSLLHLNKSTVEEIADN
jgi:hypothetical protein